jgi:hypothetical protein
VANRSDKPCFYFQPNEVNKMAISLSNAFVTLFDAEVKQAYQGKAMLVGAVRSRRGVEGSTVKFPKVGRGVATPRIAQTDVTPLNVGFNTVTLTLQDWNAAEYSDIFSQAKVNFDERQELVQVVATAMGRRQDQLILDALNASNTSLTVANTIGGSGATNMNVGKLREAKRLLDAKNVPMEGRHIVLHANGLSSLLSETAVTSSDFNTVKALVQGELNTFLGFQFHVLGDRDEGGLPIATNDRTCFAFHSQAIGYGEGIGMRTEINYIPEKTSWLVNEVFSAGAIAIDDEGIVKITCREA